MPPLRGRREDIPELLAHFVERYCARHHLPVPRLPVREVDRAQSYGWPGNIRELQNVVERAVILARGGVLELPLPEPSSPKTRAVEPRQTDQSEVVTEGRWRELEKANVLRALQKRSSVCMAAAARPISLDSTRPHWRRA
jgi:DNA-binding NtrC family response regulator